MDASQTKCATMQIPAKASIRSATLHDLPLILEFSEKFHKQANQPFPFNREASEQFASALTPPDTRTSSRSALSYPQVPKTELSKIVNGHGDWMFYGHAGPDGQVIESWWLLDLRAFRAALIRHRTTGSQLYMGDKCNADGTCFKWFDIRSFPKEPPLVVARG